MRASGRAKLTAGLLDWLRCWHGLTACARLVHGVELKALLRAWHMPCKLLCGSALRTQQGCLRRWSRRRAWLPGTQQKELHQPQFRKHNSRAPSRPWHETLGRCWAVTGHKQGASAGCAAGQVPGSLERKHWARLQRSRPRRRWAARGGGPRGVPCRGRPVALRGAAPFTAAPCLRLLNRPCHQAPATIRPLHVACMMPWALLLAPSLHRRRCPALPAYLAGRTACT